MKAVVKAIDLSKALKLCSSTVDLKDTVRSNVEIATCGDKLEVKATNTSFSMTSILSADIQEDGMAVIDCSMAYGVVAKGTGDCVLETDNNNLIIKTSGRTKLPNINHGLPMIDKTVGKTITCDAVAFRSAIDKVSYAVATDQTKLVLTGAHIVTDGVKMTITGVDGFRLAQTSIDCDGDSIDIIVPLRILDMICDAVSDGTLTINVNNIHMTAVGEGFVINAVLISGNYIDTARIIPTEFSANALVNTAELRNLADSATIASSANNLVRLDVKNDTITVLSESEKADFLGEVNAMVDGNPIMIAFNLKYLIQTLKHISTEQCEIHFTSETSPAIFTPHNNSSELNLVLPVRVFR